MAGGPASASAGSPPEIWGTDRNGTCYSLFDNLRAHSAWVSSHVSDGHEDWSVGWLAKGYAWVTSDEECASARIRVDDLHRWVLYPQPENIEFDDPYETVTIDVREQTLGTKVIGDASVSLLSGSAFTVDPASQDSGHYFTLDNAVCWKIEGPITLRAIIEEWIGHFETFSRFMTMRPSNISRINCRLDNSGDQRLAVELIAPRPERPSQSTSRDDDDWPPYKYLTTLRAMQELGIDPMDVLAAYWREVATGDSYMAMSLHLESQDRLLNRGHDGALLNAIRSVESLHAAQHPGVPAERVSVQDKIDDAVSCAGDVGTQVVDAWPELRMTGALRRDVAHGKARPSASFGLRCLGGATALQWIQRLRLLVELGINEAEARLIVADNFQYKADLRALQNWSAELGSHPAP